jgi:superfamily II DNA or RNA helicase
MAFRNKYKAECRKCGKSVDPSQGWTSGPPWVTVCDACYAAPKASAAFVAVTLDSPTIGAMKPMGYLGDAFSTYRTATEGARFDAARKCQIVEIAQLASMVERLQKAGIEVRVDSAAREAIQATITKQVSETAAAAVRADAVDEALKARGAGLYPFQRSGVAWLAARQAGALLADEMGLGKTIQTLAALPNNAAVVVVCPALAKGVWAREAAKWRPDLHVTVLSGRGSYRDPKPGEIVITNYDVLPNDAACEKLPAAPTGLVLVSDEAHALKNAKAQRTSRFRALADRARKAGGRVIGLTGTPLLNRQNELWTILQSLGLARETFGGWKQFVEIMGGEQGKYGMEWPPSPPDPAAVGKRLERVMLRRLRTEVLPDLPTKTWRTVPVSVTSAYKKVCDKALEMVGGVDKIEIDSGMPSFEQMSRARAALAAAKIGAVVELVEEFEEQGEPIVVFSAHRDPIDLLAKREGWAAITGDTPNEKRTQIEDAFQRGELKGVAATIQAGGVAITLTRAHHAIFVDQAWTPALNAQAEDRICRIGQDRGCIITILVADHVLDERVAELLARKRTVIASTVEQSVRVAAAPISEPDIDWDATVAKVEAEAKAADKKLATNNGTAPSVQSHRRLAQTDRERFIVQALQQLADDDPDSARELNDVGFSKFDGAFGHSIAVQALTGLTEKQWALAGKLVHRYRRQVGEFSG